jgi:hypothetical protein
MAKHCRKWLQRIDVLATRYESRFMARDYVTTGEQHVDGQTGWTETSVGRALLAIDQGEDAWFAWNLWSLRWPNLAAGEHTYRESFGQVVRRSRIA